MAQFLYDSLQGMNSEIITVGTLLGTFNLAVGGNTNDDEDLFQCGKCKKQFYCLGTFMLHKKTHQLESATGQKTFESLTSDVSNEPTDLQLQPIVLSESDILSFSISDSGLNLTSAEQDLHGFETNETLMMPETEDSQLKDSRDLANNFELRSAQIILTAQTSNEEPIEKLLLTDQVSENDPTYSLDQPINYLNSDGDSLHVSENSKEKEQQKNDEALKNDGEQKLMKLRCPYCLKQFNKNFDFQQHLRSHTGERPFQCVVCGQSFTQKSNVKKHMAIHKVWPQRIRTLPEKPIQKISSPNSEETVVVDETFVCQYCPATFNSFIQLKSHRKTHALNKIFRCVQKNCQQKFETLDSFLEHTAGHQTDSDTQYTCCHCKAQFNSLDDLGIHQRIHGLRMKKKKKSTVMCRLCKSKFASVESLERHQIQNPHSHPCPECGKVYVCERHLRRHLLTHTSHAPFNCNECGKSFKTQQNLNYHRITHSSEQPFMCNLCPAKFARRDRLVRHSFIHDTNHRFKCPFNKHLGCTKEFSREDKLKQHVLSHAASKNLKCQRCSRVFKRGSQLKQHETVCLSEDKPCKDCGHVTTSLEHYKKNSPKTKELSHVNRRKNRLLEISKKPDDDVPTIQVVVVPLGVASYANLDES